MEAHNRGIVYTALSDCLEYKIWGDSHFCAH